MPAAERTSVEDGAWQAAARAKGGSAITRGAANVQVKSGLSVGMRSGYRVGMRFLLVDAHSVIFSWPELHAIHKRHMETAREQLIHRLTAYQDATGIRVVVVFDGKGARTNEEKRPGGVQIFYSGRKGGADAVIERLVAKYGTEHDMTVATNDSLVQQTAITFGGLAISVESLLRELEAAGAEVVRQVRKLRQK